MLVSRLARMADVDMEKLRVAATEIIAKVVEEDKLECVRGSRCGLG